MGDRQVEGIEGRGAVAARPVEVPARGGRNEGRQDEQVEGSHWQARACPKAGDGWRGSSANGPRAWPVADNWPPLDGHGFTSRIEGGMLHLPAFGAFFGTRAPA
jgi:hypothetical protein